MYKILDNIKSNADLKKLSVDELVILAEEIRDFLVKSVSDTGGHLASNLGVVELTIALHYVFDSPDDKLIWDVGHQGYIHKILTGRKDEFVSLRQFEGLSGFLKRCESDHDCFEAGHSSTSISAGIGFSKANKLLNDDSYVISVIGDAALTGGMAFEALNYAGETDENLIVILNDNNMAISENVGGMSKYLAYLRLTRAYTGLKKFIGSVPFIGKGMKVVFGKIRDSLKYTLLSNSFFEHLGFKYIGPIDGHDINELIYAFKRIKEFRKPVFFHCITTKGKGYQLAEENPELYHAVSKFDHEIGMVKTKKEKTFSAVLGGKLCDIAKEDEKVVAITAAMPTGTGLVEFSKKYPSRYIDVGIAEQNAVTLAAGLACKGIRPFVCVYSTFLQRAYDQILHDVCLQNLNVTFCIDRAGIVGADGETHHGLFDISYLCHIPNMTVLAPKDGNELEQMLEYALSHQGPLAIRYPRGRAALIENSEIKSSTVSAINEFEVLAEGKSCAIVAVGNMVARALEVTKILETHGIASAVINPKVVCPIKSNLIDYVKSYDCVVSMEDHVKAGGFGEMLQSALIDVGVMKKVSNFAFPRTFVEHGDVSALYKKYGLDAETISNEIIKIVKGE